MSSIKRALLSVSDKNGLVDLAKGLASRGIELIASGGTARAIASAGCAVTSVDSMTGFPELLGGRVKTLHPAVHGGILSRDSDEDRGELSQHGLAPIDLVICNLYPFESTVAKPNISFEAAIEEIDIGGVTLLRAAAKNCARVTVICDSADYDRLLEQLDEGIDRDWRISLAYKAFAHTAHYDAANSGWFGDRVALEAPNSLPARFGLSTGLCSEIRRKLSPGCGLVSMVEHRFAHRSPSREGPVLQ